MSIILITGPDGGGKTTALQRLKLEVPAHYESFHHCPQEEIIARTLCSIRKSAQYPLNIWERFHYPDDIVYNEVVTGVPSKLQPDYLEWDLLLSRQDASLIYITADRDDLIRRVQERGDDYISWMMMDSILANYHKILASTSLRTFVINTSRLNIEQTYEALICDITTILNRR